MTSADRRVTPTTAMPDEPVVLAALTAALGPEGRRVWVDACRRVALEPPTATTPETLQLVLVELTRCDGVARVVGMSQLIRLRTARVRAARPEATG